LANDDKPPTLYEADATRETWRRDPFLRLWLVGLVLQAIAYWSVAAYFHSKSDFWGIGQGITWGLFAMPAACLIQFVLAMAWRLDIVASIMTCVATCFTLIFGIIGYGSVIDAWDEYRSPHPFRVNGRNYTHAYLIQDPAFAARRDSLAHGIVVKSPFATFGALPSNRDSIEVTTTMLFEVRSPGEYTCSFRLDLAPNTSNSQLNDDSNVHFGWERRFVAPGWYRMTWSRQFPKDVANSAPVDFIIDVNRVGTVRELYPAFLNPRNLSADGLTSVTVVNDGPYEMTHIYPQRDSLRFVPEQISSPPMFDSLGLTLPKPVAGSAVRPQDLFNDQSR